ncbi:AbgT family transporter [Oceanobacillus saliphilus]|uniref:AbgT family transporter n=1 Tax=Oceanobacillus saliphilus TaxID=2925834 RepID=UPI00201D7300|nr:AbgT family transporter [Oceanobacillus saliphilus]
METKKKQSFVDRFLNKVEIIGNKLPDPIVIFIILMGIILVASFIASLFNVKATNPGTGEVVEAVNLLSGEGLILILTESINNFSAFPPLGMVLVVMLGIGIAEKTGYFATVMKRVIEVAPRKLIIPTMILVAIIGNVAGDAAPVILPPLAAIVMMRLGYHPFAGLVMAYAASLGAFSANFIIGMTDALALGFTEPAAQLIDESYTGNIAMNYYFIAVSAVLLLIVTYLITTKVTIPRLGAYHGEKISEEGVSETEKSALRWANVSLLITAGIIMALVIPENGILRNPETGSIMNDSPFMISVVFLITILFFVPGLVYGMRAKVIKSSRDFGNVLSESMATMGSYIVLVFFAAQMLAYFSWSNLGPIIAIKGAEFLQEMNFTGIPLILSFVIIAGFINLLIGSASAKWAILAPVFVPLFMLLGYDPAFTQMIFRIGDSITNPITPMLPYLPLLLAFAKKYDKNVGLGTLLSNLLPYSIIYFIVWSLFLVLWYLIGLPVGPGGPIFLEQ